MASLRGCFRFYAVASLGALWVLLFHTWLRCDDFYAAVAKLTTSKFALAVEYNFCLLLFVLVAKTLLRILVGRLRGLEVEQVLDNGRGFLLDTVLFLVLSSPTLHGSELSPLPLVKYLLLLVTLKIMHIVLQIKGNSVFEAGLPRFSLVIRLFLLLVLLLVADVSFVVFFYNNANRHSTFYLWLLFEFLGMLSCSAVAALKFVANVIDVRSESGWMSKPAFMFYLDMVHDVLSLGIFLVFMLVFFATQPSRLPLYMTADILHVSKALYRRIVSFRKYRALSRNLETRFPDATREELEAADTCIICRDILGEGSKKLPCSHIFHIDCLRAWLVQQQSCPTCRADIPVEPARPSTRDTTPNSRQQQQQPFDPNDAAAGAAATAPPPTDNGSSPPPGPHGSGSRPGSSSSSNSSSSSGSRATGALSRSNSNSIFGAFSLFSEQALLGGARRRTPPAATDPSSSSNSSSSSSSSAPGAIGGPAWQPRQSQREQQAEGLMAALRASLQVCEAYRLQSALWIVEAQMLQLQQGRQAAAALLTPTQQQQQQQPQQQNAEFSQQQPQRQETLLTTQQLLQQHQLLQQQHQQLVQQQLWNQQLLQQQLLQQAALLGALPAPPQVPTGSPTPPAAAAAPPPPPGAAASFLPVISWQSLGFGSSPAAATYHYPTAAAAAAAAAAAPPPPEASMPSTQALQQQLLQEQQQQQQPEQQQQQRDDHPDGELQRLRTEQQRRWLANKGSSG